MLRASLVVATLLISAAAAHAGKPSQSQAKKAATAWLAALKVGEDSPNLDALRAVTAVPFAWISYNDEDVRCPATTAATADKLGDAVDCLGEIIDVDVAKRKVKAFHKGDVGTFFSDAATNVFGIKNARLVIASTPCAGSDTIVVLAVVKDDKTAKVAGVFVLNETCGE